jgi:hypothetical protein
MTKIKNLNIKRSHNKMQVLQNIRSHNQMQLLQTLTFLRYCNKKILKKIFRTGVGISKLKYFCTIFFFTFNLIYVNLKTI